MEICLGWPNHASYTARTCGGPVGGLAELAVCEGARCEHPWARERTKSKATAARDAIFSPHFRAVQRASALYFLARYIPRLLEAYQILMTSAWSPGDHGFRRLGR